MKTTIIPYTEVIFKPKKGIDDKVLDYNYIYINNNKIPIIYRTNYEIDEKSLSQHFGPFIPNDKTDVYKLYDYILMNNFIKYSSIDDYVNNDVYQTTKQFHKTLTHVGAICSSKIFILGKGYDIIVSNYVNSIDRRNGNSVVKSMDIKMGNITLRSDDNGRYKIGTLYDAIILMYNNIKKLIPSELITKEDIDSCHSLEHNIFITENKTIKD